MRSILLHGPVVGGCNMEGYPLRYAWFAVVSLYTMPQELPLFYHNISEVRSTDEVPRQPPNADAAGAESPVQRAQGPDRSPRRAVQALLRQAEAC